MLISFFLLYCFSLLSAQETNQLIEALRSQAKKIAEQMPKNYSSILFEIKTNGFDAYDSCDEADFDLMISKYNFTSDIINNFKIVTFAESEEFQSFQTSVAQSFSYIEEFIGAGVKTSGTIQYSKIQQFLLIPPPRLTNYKARAQFLKDQNIWDQIMTNEASCTIQEGSPCMKLCDNYLDNNCTTGSADEQNACIAKLIPGGDYWITCSQCFCAFLFFDPVSMPMTDKACFTKFFPHDTNVYDSFMSGSNKTTTVHQWN